MKKIDIGQALAILANVGVIAGIVFLGIEIRDSNTQATIATTISVSGQLATWKEFIAADGELSEIYASGMIDLGQLSSRERTQFDLMMKAGFLRLSGALIARGSDLLGVASEDLDSRVIEGEILYILDQPGFQQWWSAVDRRGIPANIVELVNSLERL